VCTNVRNGRNAEVRDYIAMAPAVDVLLKGNVLRQPGPTSFALQLREFLPKLMKGCKTKDTIHLLQKPLRLIVEQYVSATVFQHLWLNKSNVSTNDMTL